MKLKRKGRKVIGTAERPRLSVLRSLANISVQLIDDASGKTLCAAGTVGKEFKGTAAMSVPPRRSAR